MSLSLERVREIAALAHLELQEAEIASLQLDLGRILAYVEQLTELDVTGVEATTHATPLAAALRADDAPPHVLSPSAALQNAPRLDGPFFSIPKALDALPLCADEKGSTP